ncbi:hypothetical protein DICPUDRAFT_25559 [Dictyostelium purpureum]|uniref:Dickkopf N-terminal cysteine-rich domain-containing protein n=1 Tax=Dictyostelium purpureum TaxID=5786 RepID=F0Z7F5_DICPU|nr:uncharacterized protein DICPUDRAFT_25559 [Dictyostelium purpureum]EGC40132.1 hypothetical protein DICPUDRAFT_25559 [Dictyostelium purpureum]|eukprot:XP_003283322.1 hypothetical protein DICPUDRAFT_25559 [Dictyostelium purpureum]
MDRKYHNETNQHAGICKPSKQKGEICYDSEECGFGLICDSLKKGAPFYCRGYNFVGFGEVCSRSDECLGSLECIKSKCTNTKTNDCGFIDSCPSQHYCTGGECDINCTENVERICKPFSSTGGYCHYGYECSVNDTCVNGKCIKKYSLKEGEDCSTTNLDTMDACESGEAIFQYDEKLGETVCKCTKPGTITNSIKNCVTQECPRNYFCDGKTKKCIPEFSSTDKCKRLRKERDQCYINHHCVYINTEPHLERYFVKGSCHQKYCEKESISYLNQCTMLYSICNN